MRLKVDEVLEYRFLMHEQASGAYTGAKRSAACTVVTRARQRRKWCQDIIGAGAAAMPRSERISCFLPAALAAVTRVEARCWS